MTYFLNFRSQGVGGAVVDPYMLAGDGTTKPASLSVVGWSMVEGLLRGKRVLFAAHGFNVSLQDGACSLGNTEAELFNLGALSYNDIFVGVLWPGDYWLPVVNYPFEGSVAIDCGKRLAVFCNEWACASESLSFASHSLGARVVLQAVANLNRRARVVCLTAGAINRDCLDTEYARAACNTEAISILASEEDEVLKVAFPVGDLIADALHDDHALFERALGSDGPALPTKASVIAPWQIPNKPPYGHGDYFPPGNGPLPDPNPNKLWPNVTQFIANAFRTLPQSWPR